MGTGRYMSPEMLNKKKIKVKFFEKIDIYSLGVTLYNLAFDCYPYGLSDIKDDDYGMIIKKLTNNNLEFPINIGISKKFESFLRAILEKDYEKRYNIKEALEDPWIKGWDIINEEKENNGFDENFINKLITNSIPKFNKYILYINNKIINFLYMQLIKALIINSLYENLVNLLRHNYYLYIINKRN